MAFRQIFFIVFFACAPLSATSQNLDAGDIINLGNQLLRGVQQPQATTPRQAPINPQIRSETQTATTNNAGSVSEAQALLIQLGYDPGVVDGVMGSRTSSAIRQFQASQGLPQTGQVNPKLLLRLRSVLGTSAAADTGIATSVSDNQPISPSFDCARASTAVELAICSSAELAALDRRLNAIYRNALQTSPDSNGLRADQRTWLIARDRCGADADCIRYAMVHRIDNLGKLAGGQGQTLASPSPTTPAPAVRPPRTDALTTSVSLVAPANIRSDMGTYVAMPVCLEPSAAKAVQPLAEAEIGASLLIGNMNFPLSEAATILAVHDNTYLLIGGNCLERLLFALKKDRSGTYDGLLVTHLVNAPAGSTIPSLTVASPVADVDVSTERLPLTRLYLSQYLSETSREMRIEKFKRYVQVLQGRAYITETQVLSRDEITGRNPEFVANSAIDRWDAALQALSFSPPIDVAASVELGRPTYDFARGLLTFPNAPAFELDGFRYLGSRNQRSAPTPDYQEQVDYTDDFLLAFLQKEFVQFYPNIALDRLVPVPEFPMTAERAEQFVLSETRTIAELRYRIDNVSPLAENSVLRFDATLEDVRIITDTGDELGVWKPAQLPVNTNALPAAPEPEAPLSAGIARPRDILAAVAKWTGRDSAELIGSVYPPTSQDTFAQRDEIEMLASTAEPVDLGGFWMMGNGQYAEYDFSAQTFGFEYLNLTYPNTLSRNEGRIARDRLFRLTNVDDYGIRFPLAEDEARRLQQAASGNDATFRVLIVAAPAEGTGGEMGLPMEGRVAEIVVLQTGSDPQTDVEADILARIVVAPGKEESGLAVSSAPTVEPQGSYDILGIRTGQALASVLTNIEVPFMPETVMFGRRDVWSTMQNLRRPIMPTTPLAEATILVRDDGADILTIFHEPLLSGNPVTGIARTISFSEGARPAPEAVMALLVDKYGDVATQQKYAFDWFRAAQPPHATHSGEMSMAEIIQQSTAAQMAQTKAFRCKQLLSSITLVLDQDAQSLLSTGYSKFVFMPYPVVDEDNAVIALPASNPLWPIGRVEVSNPECGEDIVLAAIEPDVKGLVSVLRVLVTNIGYLAEIEAQAKQSLIENNAVGDDEIPEIKL